MSRPVRWSNDALADLAEQVAYIATDNLSAARRMADTIDKTVKRQPLCPVPTTMLAGSGRCDRVD